MAASASRFPVDGGAVDRFDKAISGPVFRLQAGLVLETILSVPGCFAGMPSFVIVSPALLGCAVGGCRDAPIGAIAVVALVALALLIIWVVCIFRPHHRQDAASKPSSLARRAVPAGAGLSNVTGTAALLFSPLSLAAAPFVGVALLGLVADARGRAAGTFHLAHWLVCMLPILHAKAAAHRRRPLASDESHLGARTGAALRLKSLPAIPAMIAEADPNASFPSGDVAGSVSLAYALWRCSGPAWLGPLCVALSALGRLYWHAHHALDVGAGGAVSLAVGLLVEGLLVRLGPAGGAPWSRAAADDGTCFGGRVEWWLPIVGLLVLVAFRPSAKADGRGVGSPGSGRILRRG